MVGDSGYRPWSGLCSTDDYCCRCLRALQHCTIFLNHPHRLEDTEALTFICTGLPVKSYKRETRPMTEPAKLPLKLRSHLFDSSHLRDRWPRLRFAYTGSGAAVTTVGFYPTTSDHERLYQSMPIVDAARAFLKLESTLKRAEDVNYADCGCWNGRSRLSDRTFHQ